jgi:hypothetical protein
MQRIATFAVLFALAACRAPDAVAREPVAEKPAETEPIADAATAEQRTEVRLLWEREVSREEHEQHPAHLRVRPVADLDRDGARDLLVTVEWVFGSARVLAVSGANGSTLWQFECPEHRDSGDACWFGADPCALGDVDHDGVVDLALADPGPHYLDGWSPPTSIHVVSGASGKVLARTVAGGRNSDQHCRFGLSLAAVDDVDGDGLADIAAFGTQSGNDEPFVDLLSAADCARVWRVPACFEGWSVELFAIADCDGDGLRDIAEVRVVGGESDVLRAACAHSSRDGAPLNRTDKDTSAVLARLLAELDVRDAQRALEPSLEDFVALDTAMRASQAAPFKPKPRRASLDSAGFVGDLNGDGGVEFWTRWSRSNALHLGSVRRPERLPTR